MRIGTGLKAIAWVAGVTAVLVASASVWTFRQLNQTNVRQDLAWNMVTTAQARMALRNEYFLYHDDRPRVQWQQQTDKLDGLVREAGAAFVAPEQELVLGRASVSLHRTKALFARLVENQDEVVHGRIDAGTGQAIERRLYSQLIIEAQTLMDELFRLQNLTGVEYKRREFRNHAVTLVALLLLAVITIASMVMVARKIKTPLLLLREGTEMIASGDLDHRVGTGSGDEIGELADAFDRMTARLRTTMVSRDSLASEVESRKRVEAQLRLLSERQEAILDAVHDIIMEVDAGKVYTWANRAGLEFFGEGVIGREAAAYFEGEQETYRTVQPLFDGGDTVLYVESWQRRKDGRKRLLAWWCRVLKDDRGRVTGALSSARDITEWHEAQIALAESERGFSTLFASMEEGVGLHEIVRDAAGAPVDYRILDVNPAFERHTGIPVARARGALASVVYGPGPPPHLMEYCHVSDGGQAIFFESYFPPLEKHFSISVVSPQPGRFATILEDVTERKQREEELRQKNAEMERFTYTISHDLRSPLVTIKTFLGYLMEDQKKKDAARVEKDLYFLHTAVDKMGELLGQLLDMSRVGRVVNPSVNVTFGELVGEALSAVAGPIAGRRVEVRVSQEPITLFGDRSCLARIWQNLIENAVKFMGDQASPRIDVGVNPAGRETVFFVRDNGMGIDPRYHEKIFGLFERLDPGTEGTGLGLALVKRIVELHGGTIGVQSEGAGSGTLFRFTLPRAFVVDQEGGVK